MKIKVHQISEEGFRAQGEEPSGMLDLKEELFRCEAPVQYDLHLSWVGKRGILARGRLSTVVKARCVRTLDWFDLPLVVEDFQCHVDHLLGDEVDLTPQMREDILLLLPANPVSPQAKPLQVESTAEEAAGSRIWGKLDQLKLK